MKKILLSALIISTFGFGQKNGTVHFEAEFTKKDFNEISIISSESDQIIKTIKSDTNGLFKADFKLPFSGDYHIKANNRILSFIFLKNNENIIIKSTKQDYFSKDGIQNFQGSLAPETLFYSTFYDKSPDHLYRLDDTEFNKELELMKQKHLQELKNLKNLNDKQKTKTEKDIISRYEYFAMKYQIKKLKGTTVPDFKLESMSDGTLIDFSSLNGKYTLIDVWASYCSPCIRQMPSLKSLEEKFHNKNIQFIGVSIDTKVDRKKIAKEIITKQQLSNPQFFIHPTHSSPLMKHMMIVAPPRFILLDPNGKVLDPDAVYPSDPELEKTLQTILNK